MNVVEKLINHFGSQRKLADFLKVKQPTVCHWNKTGLIPVSHVLKLEKETGVSREELRPDVYGEYHG